MAGQGQQVTFIVTLTNSGPDAATNIQVADAIPAGLSKVTVTPSGISRYAEGVWSLGSLTAGGFSTLTIVGQVDSTTPITNTAEVIAVDQADPDSTPGNNVASEDDQATVTVTPQQADLSLVTMVDDSSASIGQDVTFTIAVNNAGPNAATTVTVADKLPSGLEFVRAMTENGNYDHESGIWTIGQVNAGETVNLDIVATIASDQPVTNVAQVASSDQFDPDSKPGNNVESEDDQFSARVGACLTGGPLTVGMNRLVYSCVTPGGFAGFVMGTRLGSHFFSDYSDDG